MAAIPTDFQTLGPVEFGHAERYLRELTPRVLPRLAAWAKRTVEALPASEAGAPGFRDLYPNSGQFAQWLDRYQSKHPSAHCPFVWTNARSNIAERIQTYLAL